MRLLAAVAVITSLACSACNKGGAPQTTPREAQAEARENAEKEWREVDQTKAEQ